MSDADDKVQINPTSRQPLAGRLILLTRPHKQSEEMALHLESLGAQVIQAPMIATVEPESWMALDEAIEKFDHYDSLIFTSTNGVMFFFQRLQQKYPKTMTQIKEIFICAIGNATAKALADEGYNANLIASDAKAEGLLQAIIEQAGGKENLRGRRFLLPRARIAREILPQELRKLGAIVDAVETYQTIRPPTDDSAFIRLLEKKAIDVVIFTSSSSVQNFVATIGEERVAKLLHDTIIACIGPITAATAREYNLINIIQPEIYNAAALVNTIIAAFPTKPIS